jgi:rhodanese-related sulfurtransferase
MFELHALLAARTFAMVPAVPLTYRDWIGRPEVQYPFFFAVAILVALFFYRLPDLLSWNRARHKETLRPIDLDPLMSGTKMVIIDLRPPELFNGPKGHLRGSYNFPIQMLRRRIAEVASDKRQLVVLVDGSDKLSHLAAPILQSEGYTWVRVLQGGIRAWRAQRLPVATAGRTD